MGNQSAAAAVSFVTGRFAEPGPAGDFSASPYEYQLAKALPGRLFTGLRLTPRPEEFATIHTTYAAVTDESREFRTGHYAQPATGRPELIAFPSIDARHLIAQLPFHREVHYLAADLTWRANLTHGDLETGETDFRASEDQPQVYQAGCRYHRVWNQAVFGPRLPTPAIVNGQQLGVVRHGDRLIAALYPFVDAHPNHSGSAKFRFPGHTRLYRDGNLVLDLPYAGAVVTDLAPQPATYRLESAVTLPVMRVSTSVVTAWTFRSAHAGSAQPVAVPLLGVRSTPELDDRNHARPGPGFTVPVEIYRQPGAGTVVDSQLTVEVSTDDGRTWRPGPAIRTGSGWEVTVDNPPNGAVSLRLRATDTDGNQVEQTTIRAYLVRG